MDFTDSKPLKYHSDLVQLLVQKYLEEENSNIPVYMYPELINDIDVFNRRIETIKEIHDKVSAKNPLREYPKTVQAFLDIINSKENLVYTDTYEVKHESREYIFDVKNIRQLIDNGIVYPDNTKVELILVPSDTRELSKDDELYEKITAFNALRDYYLSLPEDRQREIMNVLVHDNGVTYNILFPLILTSLHSAFTSTDSD